MRAGIQSAFTNFSIFDRPYFEAIFGGKEFPDGTYMIDYEEEIMEYQKAFMNVVSKIREQNMMTFPVLTYSLLRKDGKFVDEEMARWACEHNMKWNDSNFYVSDSVTSLSNCCFDGETKVRVYKDGKNDFRTCSFKEIDESNDGKQLFTVRDKFANSVDNKMVSEIIPVKIVKLKAKDHIMYKLVVEGLEEPIICTENHIHVVKNAKKRTDKLTTEDMMLSYKEGIVQYLKVLSIERIKNYDKEYVYCFEVEDGEPYFTLDNGIITHNCRLVSDIEDMGYFNSIGGTALEVGSVKVNTVNLARIAYETNSIEEYISLLKEKTVLCLQVLDVIRHIIQRNIDKGLLPNYSKHVLDMSSQYNTIGIVGIYEALVKFGLTYKDELGNTFYTDEGINFAKDILKTITDVKSDFAKDKDYKINIEEVPAERAAAVLMEKDRYFYPNEAYELPLYGNQWIPLGVKTTLHERVRLSAILDKACSGGSILHANLDSPLENFDTAWNLLNYIADQGVTYFAFCTRINSCKHNHGFYGDHCPVCGEPVETTYQRVVGFITPVKTYSKERKAEFALRDWMELDNLKELG